MPPPRSMESRAATMAWPFSFQLRPSTSRCGDVAEVWRVWTRAGGSAGTSVWAKASLSRSLDLRLCGRVHMVEMVARKSCSVLRACWLSFWGIVLCRQAMSSSHRLSRASWGLL